MDWKAFRSTVLCYSAAINQRGSNSDIPVLRLPLQISHADRKTGPDAGSRPSLIPLYLCRISRPPAPVTRVDCENKTLSSTVVQHGPIGRRQVQPCQCNGHLLG